MKIFPYIQYFFYLGYHWGWQIAFHILAHEIKGENKYGIHTTGSDELKKTKATGVDISHATVYMPASYLLLEEVFANLPEDVRGHFLDIGSGKGRALCVAAHNGFNKVTGIDFSKQLCVAAEENLQHTKKVLPLLQYSLINKDAAIVKIPIDADCIFFFNPFDGFIMSAVAKNILESFKKNPRNIYIIYLNPLYKKEFFIIGFNEIYNTCKMKYMEAVILQKTYNGL
ncbi:MAG: class I SAM-dependent methyltransferase [Ferruginibacter sp.]